MENEMIEWFIDNLKPPYYQKMTSTQVTHFASLIPIEEHIDEGIKSKKIMIGRKTKEADVHMVNNALERPEGVDPACATPTARLYQQQG